MNGMWPCIAGRIFHWFRLLSFCFNQWVNGNIKKKKKRRFSSQPDWFCGFVNGEKKSLHWALITVHQRQYSDWLQPCSGAIVNKTLSPRSFEDFFFINTFSLCLIYHLCRAHVITQQLPPRSTSAEIVLMRGEMRCLLLGGLINVARSLVD